MPGFSDNTRIVQSSSNHKTSSAVCSRFMVNVGTRVLGRGDSALGTYKIPKT